MLSRSVITLLLAAVLALGGTLVRAQADGSSGAIDTVTDQKRVLGWVENIRLYPDRMLMKAKLDPGARSSAIHAEDIEEYAEDGRRMVRFTILAVHDDPDSERIVMERPLVREVNIKLRNTTRSDQRLAVRLEFCIAGEVHNSLFTLTTRSNFNYPVLLGRQFLRDRILVDSGSSFTHKTRCPR
jgi:hypothetical protein